MQYYAAQSPRHYSAIACLHKAGITEGFLSRQSKAFLTALYKGLNKTPWSRVIVAEDEAGAVVGFIAGALNIKAAYRHILLRQAPLFTILMLPFAFSIRNLRNIFETMLYAFKKPAQSIEGPAEGTGPQAELLSIVVVDTVRGQKVGATLIRRLEEWYAEKGVLTYGVVTWSGDPRSNAFYAQCGFSLFRQFTHHGNIMNTYHKIIGK